MKITSILLSSIFMLCVVACSGPPSLSGPPRLEGRKEGVIDQSIAIGFLNVTVVRIDPNGKEVNVDWKGFNIKSGSAFRVPFETIELKSGDEVYVISDRTVGNNALAVNGKPYAFDSGKQQVLIKFGEGVSIEEGGKYQKALKIYEITPNHLKRKAEQGGA